MKLYIKGDYTKEIPFDYLELAKRMWFDTKDGKTVDISYFGNTRPFKTDPTIHLKLNKWMHDNRWNNVQLKEGISEDDKESWLSVEEFKKRHEDILSMSYEEANELSLEEIPFMDDVRDPVWEEDDRRNEEYIRIHGEVELDDEEE